MATFWPGSIVNERSRRARLLSVPVGVLGFSEAVSGSGLSLVNTG